MIPDDIRNMVGVGFPRLEEPADLAGRRPFPSTRSSELLQAPIVFFNGHRAPEFSVRRPGKTSEITSIRGVSWSWMRAAATSEFNQGFRRLMKDIFPEPELQLHPLLPEHPVWRAKHELNPESHPLWGIEHGCRTVVIYSPTDLSCYWNQSEHSPSIHAAVINAVKVGQNVIDYATGREMPADKLTVREIRDLKK